MRKSVLGMSLLAVVLWAATGVLAQGQGKEQGGGDKGRVRERPANKAQENVPAAAETADKNASKGKAAKQADEGGSRVGEQKQGGPQAKKMEKAVTEAVAKGKGKGQDMQAQAFQKQRLHDQAKHLERQAKLARLRELAVKKGDKEMIARVDKLIAKEQEVYGRKQGKMQEQPRATPGLTGPDKAAPDEKQKSGKGRQDKEDVKGQKKAEAKPEGAKKK